MKRALVQAALFVACAAWMAGPTPASAAELSITFTGVLVYKAEGKTYTVIAPAAEAHTAFIRFPADSRHGKGFQPSGEFVCTEKKWRFVTLRRGERFTIDKDVSNDTELSASAIVGSLVHLKDLSGSRSDLDETVPRGFAHGKTAARFIVDKGKMVPVREDNTNPRYWRFYEFDEQSQKQGLPCVNPEGKPIQVCEMAGVTLTLSLKPGTERVRLKSSDERYIDLPVLGGIAEAVVGNSRAEDIVCLGTKSEGPDEDFVHHYAVVTTNQHEHPCIPYRQDELCERKAPSEINSKGGSDCLGSQWP